MLIGPPYGLHDPRWRIFSFMAQRGSRHPYLIAEDALEIKMPEKDLAILLRSVASLEKSLQKRWLLVSSDPFLSLFPISLDTRNWSKLNTFWGSNFRVTSDHSYILCIYIYTYTVNSQNNHRSFRRYSTTHLWRISAQQSLLPKTVEVVNTKVGPALRHRSFKKP